MNTQPITIQSSDADRRAESGARRPRVRRRPAAVLAAAQGRGEQPNGAPTDHPHPTHQAGGPRILRRWSVADLIARAAVAPRAFA
jgi:hypothetical protein